MVFFPRGMGEEKQRSVETSSGVFGKEACIELPAGGLADTADHTGMAKYQPSEGSPGNLQSSRGEMVSLHFLFLSMCFYESNTFHGSVCQSFFFIFLITIPQLHIINYLQIYQ